MGYVGWHSRDDFWSAGGAFPCWMTAAARDVDPRRPCPWCAGTLRSVVLLLLPAVAVHIRRSLCRRDPASYVRSGGRCCRLHSAPRATREVPRRSVVLFCAFSTRSPLSSSTTCLHVVQTRVGAGNTLSVFRLAEHHVRGYLTDGPTFFSAVGGPLSCVAMRASSEQPHCAFSAALLARVCRSYDSAEQPVGPIISGWAKPSCKPMDIDNLWDGLQPKVPL